MPVRLQKVKFIDNLSAEKREMFRAAVKSIGVVDRNKLVSNLVNENHVPMVYAKGVLDCIGSAMFDYMELGHSVQIPGLGTLQLVVNSTASETEKGCTAASVKSVRITLTPSAEIKQRLAMLTFTMTNGVAEGTATDDDGDVNTNDPNQNSNQDPTLYTLTWKNGDVVKKTEQLAAGTAITEPTCDTGYHWVDVPSTMPAQDLTIEAEADNEEPPILS